MGRYVTLKQAAQLIQAGGLVAIPTETSYGLAVDARNETAISKIFSIKKRDQGKPISILIRQVSDLKDWVGPMSPSEKKLIRTFWPGPLTLVFKAKRRVSPLLTAGTKKLGVRISPHPLVSQLLSLCKCAVTATSANVSGEPSLYSKSAVFKKMGSWVDGILESPRLTQAPGSTVAGFDKQSLVIYREGEISALLLKKTLSALERSKA